MHWMLLPLKRYADFSGRSRRKEFWMFMLFNVLVGFGLMMISVAITLVALPEDPEANPPAAVLAAYFVMLLWSLALIVPTIAVYVRRFHDQDKSGWFYLLSFVPCIGGLVVLYFMVLPGTAGPNRFGDDPKALAE